MSIGISLGSICCNQSAVMMRFNTFLASSKLAWLPLSSAAGRAADSEYLLGVGFFFHGAKYDAKTRFVRLVNFEQFPKMLLFLYVLSPTGLSRAATLERSALARVLSQECGIFNIMAYMARVTEWKTDGREFLVFYNELPATLAESISRAEPTSLQPLSKPRDA